MRMKHMRIILWVLVAIAFAGFIVLSLPKKEETSPISTTPLAGFNQGDHFTLIDQDGNQWNSDIQIKEGEYALIFFGFTHCPVICPTELQKFAVVMDILPQETANKINPVFITVDPERDTPDIMREYVPMFHPEIIGLSGQPADVENILDAWKVYYTKVEDPQFTEYTMDHSTYSYLVDHNMKILSLFRMQATAEDIAKKVSTIAATHN